MIGRIYKIVHAQSDIVYIGMTTNSLTKRWSSYKSSYDKLTSENSIYPFMVKYGIDQFKIMLVKEYDVVDRKHLMVYETLWINKLKCVNRFISFNPISQKQRNSNYYKRNKEEICAKVRAYAAANKEVIKARTKAYREKNKEAIKERKRAYTAANRDIIRVKKSEIIQCECGGSWRRGAGKLRHERTAKHQAWIDSVH